MDTRQSVHMAELRERLIPFPCMRAGMRSCGEVRRPTYGVMMRRPVERTGTEREIKKKGFFVRPV